MSSPMRILLANEMHCESLNTVTPQLWIIFQIRIAKVWIKDILVIFEPIGLGVFRSLFRNCNCILDKF